MIIRRLMPIAVLVLTLVAGCASQPHFVDSIGMPQGSVGKQLIVLPVSGVGPDVGRALGENMAWGLREAGYPAYYSTQSGPENPFVKGEVAEIEVGAQVVWLSLRWLVYDVGERVHGVHRHQVAVSLEDWTSLSPKTIALIVTEAVPAVHERVASLIFPGGFADPPRLAQATDRQLASIDGSPDGGTVVISGSGLAVIGPDESFETAQFDPVFEPAAVEPPPAVETPQEPELDSVFYAPAPPKPDEPPAPASALETVATPAAATDDGEAFLSGIFDGLDSVPAPPAEKQETFIDVSAIESLGGSLVQNDPAATTASSAGFADEAAATPSPPQQQETVETPGEVPLSPFAQIDDTKGGMNDPDILTPEAAALVTTDPWLTISEPVVVQQVAEADEFSPEPLPVVETPISETVVFDQPPPPEPPSQPSADTTQTAIPTEAPDSEAEPTVAESQAVSAEPAQIEPAPAKPATQVAAGSVSAGDLGVATPTIVARPVFLVRGVQGAPGDGNTALTHSIREALRRIAVSVTDDPQQATHILQGAVRVDSPFAGRQKVRIVWRVTGIDGSVTGQAMQENQVPQGSLDGVWGPTADAVSSGAVQGIAKLFKEPVAGAAPTGLSQPDLPHVGND